MRLLPKVVDMVGWVTGAMGPTGGGGTAPTHWAAGRGQKLQIWRPKVA